MKGSIFISTVCPSWKSSPVTFKVSSVTETKQKKKKNMHVMFSQNVMPKKQKGHLHLNKVQWTTDYVMEFFTLNVFKLHFKGSRLNNFMPLRFFREEQMHYLWLNTTSVRVKNKQTNKNDKKRSFPNYLLNICNQDQLNTEFLSCLYNPRQRGASWRANTLLRRRECCMTYK